MVAIPRRGGGTDVKAIPLKALLEGNVTAELTAEDLHQLGDLLSRALVDIDGWLHLQAR